MKKIHYSLASSIIGMIPNVFNNTAINEMQPTVTVMTDNGPVRINATDYDPEKHRLAEGEESVRDAATITSETKIETPPPPPVEKPAPAPEVTTDVAKPVMPGTMQEGAKWFVVDMNADNAKIGDTNGYPSKKKADEAAVALMPPPPAA